MSTDVLFIIPMKIEVWPTAGKPEEPAIMVPEVPVHNLLQGIRQQLQKDMLPLPEPSRTTKERPAKM
jgi:hypothetical protein